LDLATRDSLDAIKRFYVDRLEAAGFDVVDEGLGMLNPPAAAYLGIRWHALGAAVGDRRRFRPDHPHTGRDIRIAAAPVALAQVRRAPTAHPARD
jgi:hypothetical protein